MMRGLPLRLLRVLAFALRDHFLHRHGAAFVMIALKHSQLDAGTMPLLWELLQRQEHLSVALAVEDRLRCLAVNAYFLEKLARQVQVVELGSKVFYRALLSSFLVFTTSQKDLVFERLADNPERRAYVRLYHGVITKAYGRLTSASLERQARQRNRLRALLATRKLQMVRVDVRPVASEVEAFFRAASEAGRPAQYRTYGYARFKRCLELAEDPGRAWLPPATLELFERTRDKLRVLHAPTHKDLKADTSFFPLPGFDQRELVDFLKRNDIALFLRLHPSEDSRLRASGLIDGEHVFDLGTSRATSVNECFGFIDALITDYSSLYVDYLLFDRPILFIKDAWETFAAHRGLAFDYDRYFPGEKVSDFAELLRALEALHDQSPPDEWREARAFVRKVLLPDPGQDFLEQLFTHEKVARLLATAGP